MTIVVSAKFVCDKCGVVEEQVNFIDFWIPISYVRPEGWQSRVTLTDRLGRQYDYELLCPRCLMEPGAAE